MNSAASSPGIESKLVTYFKAILFLTPPLVAFGLLAIFVNPKLKQICADAGFDAHRLFNVLDFFASRGILLLAIAGMVLTILEWRVDGWARYRRWAVGFAVFLINSAVVVGISGLVIVAAIAGPALMNLK